ncbi:hypothetical protein PoB_002976000 [Plakobranchus ocellatus]|uniref:Uncharacterized protein n=1 Tax=Plakobranchus ocellatus TaxID=259542 RepID=A0AAV4A8W8_9GAST|nr:hypothetical protein PoB_002976000 [Plakobranchus ocellatus]
MSKVRIPVQTKSIFIAPLCPPSTKWVARCLKIQLNFFLIFFLSLVATLMVYTAVIVEEALDSDRHKIRLLLQLVAWVAILEALREILLSDFVDVIFPP